MPHVKLQEWLGHEDLATTQIYIDYQPSAQDSALIERAFGSDPLRLDQDGAHAKAATPPVISTESRGGVISVSAASDGG